MGLNNVQEKNRYLSKKLILIKYWWIWFIIISFVGFIVYSNQANNKKDEEKEKQKQQQMTDQALKNQGYKYVEPTMTKELLIKANLALVNGISVDDAANDFAVPPPDPIGLDGKTDNRNPYKLNWNDIKKVAFAADEENFYVRYNFYGIIPKRMATVSGDDIKSLSCNLGLSSFKTKRGKTDEGLLQIGLMYTEAKSGKDNKDESVGYDIIEPRLGALGVATPTTNQDKYGETIYGINDTSGKVSGGIGKDYVIAAFPLSDFDILPGSDITFDVSVETNSRIYHHSSVDPLLDFGSVKMGKQITYKLGSNTYISKIPKL